MIVEYATPMGVVKYNVDQIYRDFNGNCTEFLLVLEKDGKELVRIRLQGLISIKDCEE